ncbi:glycosyltransferase 87 family protein [Microbacterium sp. zg.Y1090]|uniref:glycosyltransferase 87 family protein n=1 Tax=Microbacterium wangruii TaxID=3049073 RepID=UPI00214C343D|nr:MULTISPECIES: glycosyltransferase 87 family protein [unclassified Microbacterium]MCR2818131.1 glycosyltransferase 87 family protein [Microbacterium sp. zg.Y1090]WIM27715.1 glycosyltransferase 87 family protein [Microbacterium sp. zg-Y1090]
MSRRAVLWLAFVVVHAAVAGLGFALPNQPMGDVYLVYEPWAWCALRGGLDGFCPAGTEVMGVTLSWVYPPLALLPMIAAWPLSWIGGYTIGWALVVTAVDALAFALLVGRGRSRGRTAAAAFWLAAILALGPVGMYRLDGLTVALAIAGCLWLAGRPLVASALLAIATWMKVWPAALLAAALVAGRRRGRVIGGAAAVSLLVVAGVVAAGGGAHVFGFVAGQTGRGLQLEAPVSAVYLWQAVRGTPGAQIYYERELLTFQVTGAQVDLVIAVMTPLLAGAVLAVAALGAVKAWRGARFAVLLPPLALSLVTVLIVFNKVGSPQFATWLVAPLVLGLVIDRRRWWAPAALGLVTALLTQLVYPVLYGGVLSAAALPVGVLTVRNALYIALLVWAVVRLAAVPVPARVRRPASVLAPSP